MGQQAGQRDLLANPLLAGQRVSVEIDGIGTLTNPVVDDTDDLEDADSVAAK